MTLQTGLHLGLTRYEYEAIPAINQSLLKLWAEYGVGHCPKKFEHVKSAPREATESQVIGNALECLLFNGKDIFDHYYPCYADGVRRGKKYDEFLEQHPAATHVLTADEHAMVTGMANALGDYKRIFAAGKKAVVVAELSGTLCKGEIDLFIDNNGCVYDLKTTRDASPKAFGKDAFTYGYHIQAAFYLDLLHAAGHDYVTHFGFLCVEKSEPYCTNCFMLDANSQALELGRNHYKTYLASYLDYLKTPSRHGADYTPFTELTLPVWATME